jgi:DNA-binding NtrC family response regulator
MGERQPSTESGPPGSVDPTETSGALDPLTGLSRDAVTLVIGQSAGERESVARAVHRAQCGAERPFLRIGCAQDESLLRQELKSWMAGPSGESSPRLLTRLERGSLFLDRIEALGAPTQLLLREFLERIQGTGAERPGESTSDLPWKGQLVVGSERSLSTYAKAGGLDPALAHRLDRIRIVLNPDEAEPEL